MKLRWEYGDEAVCPVCGHHNACIQDYTGVFECRDCHRQFRTVVGSGPRVVAVRTSGELKGRKIIEQDCVEVAKPLPPVVTMCGMCHRVRAEVEYEGARLCVSCSLTARERRQS